MARFLNNVKKYDVRRNGKLIIERLYQTVYTRPVQPPARGPDATLGTLLSGPPQL
jgi:hypothetical protein